MHFGIAGERLNNNVSFIDLIPNNTPHMFSSLLLAMHSFCYHDIYFYTHNVALLHSINEMIIQYRGAKILMSVYIYTS